MEQRKEKMNPVWKKFVGLILAVCTLAPACVTSAASVDYTEGIDGSVAIQPMSSYIQLDTKVTVAGASWTQPWGYSSYRIWVDNTTGTLMTVTITSPGGQKKNLYVPADTSKTYTENSAKYGKYRVSFQCYGDTLSGTIRVRVSETSL